MSLSLSESYSYSAMPKTYYLLLAEHMRRAKSKSGFISIYSAMHVG
jgi:hypothetical protein